MLNHEFHTKRILSTEIDAVEQKLRETFALEYTREKWRPIVRQLGTKTDAQLAKKFGFNKGTIASIRRKMSIAPENFERLCERYGAQFEREIL